MGAFPRWLRWAAAGLLFCLLATAGALVYCHAASRAQRARYVEEVGRSLDKDGDGLSVFRLRRDAQRPSRFRWQFLFVAQPNFPLGPLPLERDYRVALVGGFVLPRAQEVRFRSQAADGIRVRLDGRHLYSDWGEHGRVRAAFRARLAAGRHVLEIEYGRSRGEAVLDLIGTREYGIPLDLLPLKAGVNPEPWQVWPQQEEVLRKWRGFLLALLFFWLLLGPAALLFWYGPRLRQGWQERNLTPAMVAGLLVALASQLPWSIGHRFEYAYWRLILLPLLAGLICAGLKAAALRWRPGLAQRAGRLAEGIQGRLAAWENWLTPALVFAAFFAYTVWLIKVHGGLGLINLVSPQADAKWYRSIAVYGYVLNLHDSARVTGNYVWFPFYPLVSRLLFKAGVPDLWFLSITAWTAAAGAFFLLFRTARQLFGLRAARWALAALACYPCSFFLLLGYPYGLTLCLCLGYFLALWHGRYAWSLALGFALGLSYPSAVVAAVLPAFILAPRIRLAARPWREALWLALCTGAVLAGPLAVCLHHWWYFDDLFLPISGMGKWGRHLAWPTAPILQHLAGEPALRPENLIVLTLLLGMALFAFRYLPVLWALLAVVFLFSPFTGSLEANYRQYILAWPFFLLLASAPRPLWLRLAFLVLMLYFGSQIYLPLWLRDKLV